MKRAVLYTCFALALSACTRDDPNQTLTSTTETTSASMPTSAEPRGHAVASFLDDNPMLTRRVEAVLASEPSLSNASSNVNVSAAGEVVTLAGTVNDYASLDAIEATVKQMPGVKRVYNDVRVMPITDQAQIDENIAFSLQRSLADQPRVSIEVVRGVVMLRGEPSSSRDHIQRIAERTPGVRAVVNHLSEPAETDTLVQ
jgi:osmotically-inducible protein OsmY